MRRGYCYETTSWTVSRLNRNHFFTSLETVQIAVATPLFTNFLFASHPFVTFRGMSKYDDRTTYKEMLIYCWTTARSSCVHQSDEFKLLKYVFDTLKVSLSSQNCLWSPPKLYVIFMLASLIWLITLFNFIYSRLQWKDFHFWWVKFQQSCLYINLITDGLSQVDITASWTFISTICTVSIQWRMFGT